MAQSMVARSWGSRDPVPVVSFPQYQRSKSGKKGVSRGAIGAGIGLGLQGGALGGEEPSSMPQSSPGHSPWVRPCVELPGKLHQRTGKTSPLWPTLVLKVGPRAAAVFGSLLEMQIPRPFFKLTKSASSGVGPSNSCFDRPSSDSDPHSSVRTIARP